MSQRKGRGSILLLAGAIAMALPMATQAQAPPPPQAAASQQFDIPAGSLADALSRFSEQSGIQVLYEPDLVEGKRVPAFRGTASARDALRRLLGNSGVVYEFVSDNTAVLRRTPQATPAPKSGRQDDKAAGAAEKDEVTELERITVTGTRIRGAEVSSPVVTITQEEMRLSGHTNLGEAIRALPQNFSGGQNPEVGGDASLGGQANQNITGGSSLNLRGLGPGATLTLLNGTRLPYDGQFQATDVSVIPVAAIERMEILLDGASAIYGSDAVGGVANIILKRDYQGAELSARYGAATDGGYEQQQYTAVAGHVWGSGGFLITGDISRNTGVRARQRDYLGHIPDQNSMIYFPSTQKGGLFSGHQDLGSLAELTLDAFYTERRDERLQTATVDNVVETDSTIWGIAPALRFTLPGEWSLRIHGAVGRDESARHQKAFDIATGAQRSESLTGLHNRAEAAGVEAEGPLFALPGGEARFSIGGGYRRNTFQQVNLITGTTGTGGADRSHYLYGEIDLPLVSEEQAIPFVTRLSVNGAFRYENYKSFGETTTPKVGVTWGLAPGFDVKASWGKSFKVPTLSEQYQSARLALLYPPIFAPGAPAGTTVMQESGGNPDLGPERAEIATAGFIAYPQFLPGFSLEFSWFDIDYTDRVVIPITSQSQTFTNPAFAEFVTLNPTIAQQDAAFAAAGLPVGTFTTNLGGPDFTPAPYDPATVYAILHNRLVNAAAQHVSGVDLTIRYTTDLFGGSFTASGNASWIDDGTRKLTDLAPEFPTAGVSYFPPKFRGRFGASWSRERFTLASNVNYIGGVTDTGVTPNVARGSMTTLDLVVDYQMESGPLGDIGFNLAVTNLFNQRPPFLQPAAPFVISYDSTNYSALGRVVSATLTKRF